MRFLRLGAPAGLDLAAAADRASRQFIAIIDKAVTS
jgi:hypothetical protein